MERLNNHDAWCIDWYRRLIADGTAEDGQRISVMLYDQNAELKAKLEKAVEDIHESHVTTFPCPVCSHGHAQTGKACIKQPCEFEWRGLEGAE